MPLFFKSRILIGETIFRKNHKSNTWRIGLRTLAKIGRHVDFFEAETMRYVAEHTTIPVPKVHDFWSCKGVKYITMDFVEGVALDEALYDMSEGTRQYVVQQLKGYVAQLRALPPPVDGGVSSISGGYLRDQARVGMEIYGPFKTHDDFHMFLRAGHDLEATDKFLTADKISTTHGPSRRYATKLTHGDLASRNILVKMDGTVTAILDWECSGWFPEYWEYTRACYNNPIASQFWVRCIPEITGRYDEELEVEQQLLDTFGCYLT
ncbi:kinase-like domain-containing protein [Crassisporium funariophilum]|nr:kinase-like domain-containing protein [Crassisporium funariophilum]